MNIGRHPAGLYVLFFSEMWERFSYYGMRALLMTYMVNYFLWAQADAAKVYKWYSSAVYLTPILGGYLADRYLGNKRAVLIGGILMSIGHILMAIDAYAAFFSALGLLIVGNGFFKPNISTQVGRLYPPNDARRDAAYTIFYVGINLGAMLSPIILGWIQAKTPLGFHGAFAMAGVGMVLGLITYFAGQRWVVELDSPAGGDAAHQARAAGGALLESEAEAAPSVAPRLNRAAPRLVTLAAYGLVAFATVLGVLKAVGSSAAGFIDSDNVASLGITAGSALLASWILFRTRNGVRDRVIAMYAICLFVIFFWAAFEQAGNTMTLWADKSTDRYLTIPAPPASVHPLATGEDATGLNPVPTAWFQSINSAAIIFLGPIFAWLWTWLEERKRNPSIPLKMVLGLVFMSLGLVVMVFAGRREDQPSSTPLASVPSAVALDGEGRLCTREDDRLKAFHAGRLRFDASKRTLEMTGVLPDIERDRIARLTAPADFATKLKELLAKSESAAAPVNVSVRLDAEPPGFDLRYAGIPTKELSYDAATHELKAMRRLADRDEKAILVAAADPGFRAALDDLYVRSSAFRVSSWWLFWFYIFSTFGELCLSPVGLSMVSKLAPARFATMLMGLWFLMTFIGTFCAGAGGEIWGTVAPIPYFAGFAVVLAGAAVVLLLFVPRIRAMMHGAK